MGILNNPGMESVGLIPAAGRASRISPLPCSKEIFPVGFSRLGQDQDLRPKVAAHYLLEKMQVAGTKKAFVILRDGKWDIPQYFGDGSLVDMPIGYLMVNLPYGVPFTIDAAFPFIEDKRVVFGFPDILFQPEDAFVQLMEKMSSEKSDIVLGLFPAMNPQKMDMVDLNAHGDVQGIQIKPAHTQLKYTWIIAVWNFSFSKFLHHFVLNCLDEMPQPKNVSGKTDFHEIYMGDVIQAAVASSIKIDSVIFDNGRYVDIGTSEDMLSAIQEHTPEPIDTNQGKRSQGTASALLPGT